MALALTANLNAEINGDVAVLIAIAGFAGMLADSLLGSIFQARYQLNDGSVTESAAMALSKTPEKGWSWMTNDLVNLLSNILVTAMLWLLIYKQ